MLVSKLELVKLTYIVLLEECEVTDDSDPHEEGGGSQQDGTEVVRGHVLWRETSRRLTQQTTQRQLLKGCCFFFFNLTNISEKPAVKHEPWFPVRRRQTHLGFNANFDDAARDCEDVADDQKDVPAIDELQAVGPAHLTAQDVPEVLHVLLTSTQSQLERKDGHTLKQWADASFAPLQFILQINSNKNTNSI